MRCSGVLFIDVGVQDCRCVFHTVSSHCSHCSGSSGVPLPRCSLRCTNKTRTHAGTQTHRHTHRHTHTHARTRARARTHQPSVPTCPLNYYALQLVILTILSNLSLFESLFLHPPPAPHHPSLAWFSHTPQLLPGSLMLSRSCLVLSCSPALAWFSQALPLLPGSVMASLSCQVLSCSPALAWLYHTLPLPAPSLHMLSSILIEQYCSKGLVYHCSSKLVQRHHELRLLKEPGVLSLFEDQGRLYSSQGQDCPKTLVYCF